MTINPAASYDGFYLLAYGVFAARGAAVTGPELGRAPRLRLAPRVGSALTPLEARGYLCP